MKETESDQILTMLRTHRSKKALSVCDVWFNLPICHDPYEVVDALRSLQHDGIVAFDDAPGGYVKLTAAGRKAASEVPR